MSCGNSYGDLATLQCETGYELDGVNATVECLSDGSWNTTGALCVPVVCDIPVVPDFGNVNYTDGSNYSSVAMFFCDTGYRFDGAAWCICQANGTWSDVPPSCIPIDCGIPVIPTGGAVETPNGTSYTNSAIFSCDIGTVLVGSNISICLSNGTWNGSTPSCDPVVCGNLDSPDFGYMEATNYTNYLSAMNYHCDVGYVLSGDSVRECLASGNWSGTDPSCDPIDCYVPPAPDNGTVTIPYGTYFKQTAFYSCFNGYNMSGVENRTCDSDGLWSDMAPICVVVDCGEPYVSQNGHVHIPNGTTFNMSVFYNCSIGYQLISSNVSTCLNNSKWSEVGQTCAIQNCGQLLDPTNGNVSMPLGTTYGQHAVFTCETGFKLSSAEILDCGEDGTWNATSPSCDKIGILYVN